MIGENVETYREYPCPDCNGTGFNEIISCCNKTGHPQELKLGAEYRCSECKEWYSIELDDLCIRCNGEGIIYKTI